MCTNLKHVVLVLAYFCFYPLISAISKTLKCAIYQLTLGILASSQISIKLQPKPFVLALCTSQMEWILGCHNDSEMALSHFLSLTQSNWSNNLVKTFSCPPKQNKVSNNSTEIQVSQPVLRTNAYKAKKDLMWNSVFLDFWTDSSVLCNWP